MGLALLLIGGGVLAFASSAQGLVAGRIVCGIGAVLFSVMVADWFAGNELVPALACLVNTWPIGIALALFVLGPVSRHAGVSSAFLCTAGLAALSLILVSPA